MAMDTAADSLIGLTLIEAGTPPAAPARRHYWQLPMFAAGVAAALVAWKAFPPKPESPGDGYRRDLSALAGQIDKRPVDATTLEAQTHKIGAVLEQYPSEAARAHFLLGSANGVLAEYGAPESADAYWLKATEEFTRCDPLLLADAADQARYTFRAAKAAAAIGVGHPASLVPALVAIPPGEDVGERSRLLGETYLRLTPPDTRKARDELTAYLSGSFRGNPTTVARMKLSLADLCAKLNEPDTARKWLKEIGTAAPGAMQAAAKAQLGRLAAADGKWDEASKLFAAALAAPGLPEEQAATIRLETARSLIAAKNPVEAVAYLKNVVDAGKASAEGPGPSAVAAAITLVELQSQDPAGRGNRAQSADYIEGVARTIKSGSEFKNPHLTLDELRVAIEGVIRVAVKEGDYDAAIRTVAAYSNVAEPRKELELRADIYTEQAKSLGTKPEAAAVWRSAAADFAALAAAHPSATAKLEFHRRAAAAFRRAGDDAAAVASLQAVELVEGLPPDIAAGVALDKGDLQMAAGKFAEACDAYKQAIGGGGIAGTQAQLKLGRAHIDEARRRTDPSEARGLLELGMNLLAQMANKTFDASAEREAQQEAVYELGKLQMGRNVVESEARFRQLLQLDPAGPYAEKAKLWLGSCLLLLARGEHRNNVPPADADKKLNEALALFQELSQSRLPYIQAQADIRIVNVTLMLKRYDEMPALCNKLSDRYKQKPEELIVLGMLYTSYVRSERADLASRTIARMQDAFGKIPDAAFPGGMEEYTRAYWTKWFEQVKQR